MFLIQRLFCCSVSLTVLTAACVLEQLCSLKCRVALRTNSCPQNSKKLNDYSCHHGLPSLHSSCVFLRKLLLKSLAQGFLNLGPYKPQGGFGSLNPQNYMQSCVICTFFLGIGLRVMRLSNSLKVKNLCRERRRNPFLWEASFEAKQQQWRWWESLQE